MYDAPLDPDPNTADVDIVPPTLACPKCSEQRMDYLTLDDDAALVRCETCFSTYTLDGTIVPPPDAGPETE